MENKKLSILLVEDELHHAELVRRAFMSSNQDVSLTVARSLHEANDHLGQAIPDLVIADFRLPDGEGTELLPGEREELPYPVIILTSQGHEQVAVQAMKAGALDYVVKSENTLSDLPYIVNRGVREWSHIIARKQAEEQLRKLSRAVEQSSVSVVITNLEGEMEYVNPKVTKLTGYSELELLGQKPSIWKSGRTSDEEYHALWETIESGEVWRGEFQNRKKNGELYWELASISPIKNAAGKSTHYLAVKEDITERKLAEEALRESEARWRSLTEDSPDHIFTLDNDLNITYANSGLAHEPMEQLIGKSFLDHAGPTNRQEMELLLAKVLSTGKPDRFETISAGPVSEKIFFESRVVPRVASGEVIGLTVSARDISKIRSATQEVARLGHILEDSLNEVYIFDAKTLQFELVNRGARANLGYTMNELVGMTPFQLKPEFDATSFADLLAPLRAGNKEKIQFKTVHVRKDGSRYPVEEHLQMLDYESSSFFAAIVLDITEREHTERMLANERASLAHRVAERTAELSTANAELARAARLKDEFLASMSHELRTPLNAILARSEILKEGIHGPLTGQQEKSLTMIEESGRHLLSLIGDILDVAKLGAGRMDLEILRVPAQSVCQSSLGLVKEMAHRKQIKLLTTFDEEVTTIEADERRLKQILANLLSNAVKFTPENGRVGLELLGDPDNGVVKIVVWDTGIGISPEDMATLFGSGTGPTPFVQLDSSLSRKYEGTGLGLSLVYHLTELHGGSVSVESEEGVGSRFVVSLPWKPLEASAGVSMRTRTERVTTGPLPLLPGEEASTVLLVEDNKSNVASVLEYLSFLGHRVVVASNGAEALVTLEVETPDIVLMDIQMPVMDGLEATRRIRADSSNKAVPIIALTALAMPGDRERCIEAGANDYMSKPFRMKELSRLIDRHLPKKV